MAAKRRVFMIDAGLVVLLASVRPLVELGRGLVHMSSDLGTLFAPTFAWWWLRPRWLGGWNPWIFAGYPANADPQYGQLHPVGIVYALFDPVSAAALEGVIDPALAGVGMLAYLRVIGCARPAALVGAISFALCGFLTGHAAHPVFLRAAIAIPWALAAIERLQGRGLVAGLGGVFGLLCLSGHPQSTVYAAAVVGIYALWFVTAQSRARTRAIAAGLALGVGLGAPVWLTAPELIAASTRASETMTPYSDPALGIRNGLALVSPFMNGGGTGSVYGEAPATPGFTLPENSGYAGMVPWLLLIGGAPLLIFDPRGRFWLAMAGLGLVLATGVVGAGHPQLRAPVRFLLWFELAIAATSGIVLDRLLRREGAREEVPSLRAIGAAASVLLMALVTSVVYEPEGLRPAITSAVVLAASTAVVVATQRALKGAGLLVTCVVALDLALFATSMPFGIPPTRGELVASHPANGFGPKRTLDDLRRVPALLAKALATVGDAHGRALVVPAAVGVNWAPMERVQLVQGYGSLVPKRLADLVSGGDDSRLLTFAMVTDPALAGPANHALDLLRARVVAVRAEWDLPVALAFKRWSQGRDSRWRRLENDTAGWLLYENLRARPVAWLVHSQRVATEEEALRLIRGEAMGPGFDPTNEVLTPHSISRIEPARSGEPESVTVEYYGEDEVRLAVEARSAALLVTSDASYPGWQASVDGARVPLLTVNVSFRAVRVPEGRHEVVFRYRPWRSRAGLAIAAVAAFVLTLLAATAIRPLRTGS